MFLFLTYLYILIFICVNGTDCALFYDFFQWVFWDWSDSVAFYYSNIKR